MTFQHFPHINVWGRKFDLAVIGQRLTYGHHCTNLADLESPMPDTKNQPQGFIGSGEEDF